MQGQLFPTESRTSSETDLIRQLKRHSPPAISVIVIARNLHTYCIACQADTNKKVRRVGHPSSPSFGLNFRLSGVCLLGVLVDVSLSHHVSNRDSRAAPR